jgi:hypothetical protein
MSFSLWICFPAPQKRCFLPVFYVMFLEAWRSWLQVGITIAEIPTGLNFVMVVLVTGEYWQ